MSEVKLKPCPFCGDQPEVEKHFKRDEYCLVHRCEYIPAHIDFTTMTGILKRWNARHHTADTSKMVITDAMVEVAEDAYMPFGDMNIALHAAFASQSLGVPVKTLPHLLHELACDAAESADADIWSALVDMFAPQWHPIEKSARSGEAVLLYESGRIEVGCISERSLTVWVDPICGDDLHMDPTHWMPLPIAPIKTHQIDSEKERLAKKIAEDSGMISRSTSP